MEWYGGNPLALFLHDSHTTLPYQPAGSDLALPLGLSVYNSEHNA